MSLPRVLDQCISAIRSSRRRIVLSFRPSASTTQQNTTWDLLLRTFDLGFTAFGGPPVHFQIQHQRFVDGNGKTPLIDEQTYQELFSICQALPGPASTKLLFCIAFLRGGFLIALLVFFIWSLPGALGMYLLSLGISRVDPILPGPVYAFLSGLNSATVGIIALAGVQLARKAITDPLTRLIVLISACAGLCYNALWYFPTIMAIGGVVAMIWDHGLRGRIGRLRARIQRQSHSTRSDEVEAIPMETLGDQTLGDNSSLKSGTSRRDERLVSQQNNGNGDSLTSATSPTNQPYHKIPLKFGIAIIVGFFAIFTALMILRATLRMPPLAMQLFTNMFLAGTIIFGGGPVVIPLLREYVVQPGWVSPRDFLIGLALIQAFPGPNFNFAVYLGALALRSTNSPTIFGAFLGFFGIFFPGLTLALGFQSLWRLMRSNRFVLSILRGVNAGAVGLVFTAVYRLWEIGYVRPDASQGVPLGGEPWWVAVAASAYVGADSFGVPTALSIIGGGALGLLWYAVSNRS